MGERSKIEWTEATWNPVTGCTKVSAGCKHCYAERLAHRWGRDFSQIELHPERLALPLRWKRPRRIFVNSMSDLFHEAVHDSFIDQVFAVMALVRQHTFQVLTKRALRMQSYMVDPARAVNVEKVMEEICLENGWCAPELDWPLPNVWLGVSVEDQRRADERIPLLFQTPAAVRFLSVEPMLGIVKLVRAMGEPEDEDWEVVNRIQYENDDGEPEEFIEECDEECDWINYGHRLVESSEHREWVAWRRWRAQVNKLGRSLDWVICGGESGPGARSMDLEWAWDLRMQCDEAGVPFFMKQDSGPRPGMQGRIPDYLWVKEFPDAKR